MLFLDSFGGWFFFFFLHGNYFALVYLLCNILLLHCIHVNGCQENRRKGSFKCNNDGLFLLDFVIIIQTAFIWSVRISPNVLHPPIAFFSCQQTNCDTNLNNEILVEKTNKNFTFQEFWKQEEGWWPLKGVKVSESSNEHESRKSNAHTNNKISNENDSKKEKCYVVHNK